MYDFQYNYIKPTVSVCQYYWQTLTVELMKLKLKMCMKTIEKNKDKFDNSDYPENTLYLKRQTKGVKENTRMKLHLSL